MKNLKIFFAVLFVLAFSQTAFSQMLLGGKVVGVIDGKTAVVEIQSGVKLNVVLEFIETPEPEQPLHQTVKEHLEKLILGRYVQVLARGITQTKTVGRIFVGKIDVSQQMIRDGAAWYAVAEKIGQTREESEVFQTCESLAKAERRGIWSMPDLKPAWEFRAEKDSKAKELSEAKQAKVKVEIPVKPKPLKKKFVISEAGFSTWQAVDMGSQIWKETTQFGNLGIPNADGLVINRNAEYNTKLIMTKPVILEMKSGGNSRKPETGFGYLSFRESTGIIREGFGVAMKSESEKETFGESNDLIFIADGESVAAGKALQLGQQSDKTFQEILVYEINRETIVKVAAAGKVQIKVGNYTGEMPEKLHSMIKKLIIEASR